MYTYIILENCSSKYKFSCVSLWTVILQVEYRMQSMQLSMSCILVYMTSINGFKQHAIFYNTVMPKYNCAHLLLPHDIREKYHSKFLFIAISGIFLGMFEGSYGSHRAAPEPICLSAMTQAGREHATQCIILVHADELCIAPQRVIEW